MKAQDPARPKPTPINRSLTDLPMNRQDLVRLRVERIRSPDNPSMSRSTIVVVFWMGWHMLLGGLKDGNQRQ